MCVCLRTPGSEQTALSQQLNAGEREVLGLQRLMLEVTILVSKRKHRLPLVLAIFKVNPSDSFIPLLS